MRVIKTKSARAFLAKMLVSSCSIAVIFPVAAFAQTASVADATETDQKIQEIIVTAQRRSQSAQSTPLAIQVLSGAALEQAGVSQAVDVQKLVPGVQISQGGASTLIYIRGVGDFGVTATGNPAVAFNVDGVYVGRPMAISGNFYDLDRIEVLKGPQGTLYGRGASGGAVNALTNRPSFAEPFSGALNLEGGSYDEVNVDGALNVRLSDKLAIRGAFQVVSRRGYLSDGNDDDKHQAGRLSALWKPSDRISLLIEGDYVHLGGRGPGYALLPGIPGDSPWTGTDAPGPGALFVSREPFPGAVSNPSTLPVYQDNRFANIHAELNVDFDFATLTVIPAYRRSEMSYSTVPGFRYSPGYTGTPDTADQTSLELRLANSKGRLKWIIGAYYFNESQNTNVLLYDGFIQNQQLAASLRAISFAGFADLTYSATDKLRLIAGVRYTSDKHELTGSLIGFSPSLQCSPPATQCLSETYSGAKTYPKTTFRGGVEYDVAPQHLLYATVSTGFKSGGFNQAASNTPGSNEPESYDPETLTAYEIGSKNRFLDGRLQANFELFYWQYDNHQEAHIGLNGRGNLALDTLNAGKAHEYGFDFDGIYRVTKFDTLTVSAEYIFSKYDSFTYSTLPNFTSPAYTGCAVSPGAPPFVTVNCSGFPLTHAPKWSGSASYSHDLPLGDFGTVTAAADMKYSSSYWIYSDFVPAEHVSGHVVWNANLTYRPAHGRWSVTGFVRNIGNTPVYSGGFNNLFVPSYLAASIGAPRTFGARLHFDL